MIYVYMITTNYHSVLRPVVNISFAVIVIKSQVREEEQRGDVRHCLPPPPRLSTMLISAVDTEEAKNSKITNYFS